MKFLAFISGPPPDGFVEQALCRGTKYLCLMTHANPEAIPNFPKSNQLEYLDIIEPVNGPTKFQSPIVVVPKPSGNIRICVDMRQANQSMERE